MVPAGSTHTHQELHGQVDDSSRWLAECRGSRGGVGCITWLGEIKSTCEGEATSSLVVICDYSACAGKWLHKEKIGCPGQKWRFFATGLLIMAHQERDRPEGVAW